ncbi:hypothetical protein NIA69_16810 [Gemmiger formicilis]|nr:hypothetical protein [Gemmiger formicilis]
MAEKKKWAPTKMFLQWCLSYLLISVIALTLLLASGYRYLDVLRDNLEYTNGIQLDMTRVWLDQKVKLLRNITAKRVAQRPLRPYVRRMTMMIFHGMITTCLRGKSLQMSSTTV